MGEDRAVAAIVEAWNNAPYNAADKSIDFALQDTKLPEFVRKALHALDQDATTKFRLEREGKMPALYARYEGRACRVTIVSRMGDIGISFTLDRTHGYDKRGLSIYDLTDYSATRPQPPKWKRKKK